MEQTTPNPTTSFIPKKSLSENFNNQPDRYVKKRSVIGLGTHIMIFIFVLAVAASFAVFAYTNTLMQEIKKQEATLKTIHEQFDERVLHELIRNDHRLRNIATLLNKHIAPSNIFSEIEKNSLKNVSLEKLHFRELQGGGVYEVGATGIANDFESVLLQVKEYEKDKSFGAPVVSHLEYTDRKQLLFGLIIGVSPSLVSYSK